MVVGCAGALLLGGEDTRRDSVTDLPDVRPRVVSTRPVALWYPPQTIETRAGFPVTPLAEGLGAAASSRRYPSVGAVSSPVSASDVALTHRHYNRSFPSHAHIP